MRSNPADGAASGTPLAEIVRLPGQSIVVRSRALRAGLSRHILTRSRSLQYSTTRHCAPLPLTSDPLARQANNNS